MNIYELLNRFWVENEYDTFSKSDICLYFFLLDKANQARWQMPFKYKTELISAQLGISRNNILKARDRLSERGLITYQKGTGNNIPASYCIIDRISNATVDVTHNDTVNGAETVTDNVTHYNIKDKDVDKDNSFYKEGYMSLEKLESSLLSDREWQSQIQARISQPVTQAELMDYLNTFFAFQNKKGIRARAIEEVKNHFQNWLNQKLKTKNENGNNRPEECDPRRGTEIKATSPEDYKRTV